MALRRRHQATVLPYAWVVRSKSQLKPRKRRASAQFTGRIKNQPTAPPAIAPGINRMEEISQERMFSLSPPGADSPPSSPAGRPNQIPIVDWSSRTLTRPPNKAKLHHGRASLPWPPCPPGLRLAKIQAARAGVKVMAFMAEMSIVTEMVKAN